jgi:multidrug efflux pump subunit AcrA (membrane-fusion protein)
MNSSFSEEHGTIDQQRHPDDRPTPPRHVLRRIIIIVLLLVIGVLIAGWLYVVRVHPPRRDVGVPPPYVETLTVEPETVTERYLGYGLAAAEQSTRLAAEVASTVIERVNDIRVGTKVAQGQPLLRFDDREYRAAMERAEALVAADKASVDELDVQAAKLVPMMATAEEELRITAAEFERVSGLYEREMAADKELNVAKLAFQQTRRQLQGLQREAALLEPRRVRLQSSTKGNQAAAEMARLNIARCLVTAPFDGVIEELTVDVGDRVGPGTHVATVIDPSRVEIPVRLPASNYDSVHVGSPCDLLRETTPNLSWTGEVARIGPSIDPQSRTFAVYLVVDNGKQQRPLVPGAFLRAAVHGPTHTKVLVVPRSAIRDHRVFVVEDGMARARPIQVRHYLEERAVVDGALRSGDRVVLTNLDILADGSPVRIAESNAHTRPADENALLSDRDTATSTSPTAKTPNAQTKP